MSEHEKYCKDPDCLEQTIAHLRTELADVKHNFADSQVALQEANQKIKILTEEQNLDLAAAKEDLAKEVTDREIEKTIDDEAILGLRAENEDTQLLLKANRVANRAFEAAFATTEAFGLLIAEERDNFKKSLENIASLEDYLCEKCPLYATGCREIQDIGVCCKKIAKQALKGD